MGQPTPSLAVYFCTVKALARQDPKKAARNSRTEDLNTTYADEARRFGVIVLPAHCIPRALLDVFFLRLQRSTPSWQGQG